MFVGRFAPQVPRGSFHTPSELRLSLCRARLDRGHNLSTLLVASLVLYHTIPCFMSKMKKLLPRLYALAAFVVVAFAGKPRGRRICCIIILGQSSVLFELEKPLFSPLLTHP